MKIDYRGICGNFKFCYVAVKHFYQSCCYMFTDALVIFDNDCVLLKKFEVNTQPVSFMKKISIVLVSMVYMLPGVLAVLAHTHALDPIEKVDAPEVTESGYAVSDSLQRHDNQ